MKRLLLLFTSALVFAVALCACGGSTPAAEFAEPAIIADGDMSPDEIDNALATQTMLEQQAPTTAPAATAPATPSETLQAGPAKERYAVADTAQIDDLLVRVNSAKTTTSSDTDTPKAGFQFLLVDINIQNRSTQPVSVAALVQATARAAGKEYPLSTDASMDVLDVNGVIAPGELRHGVLGYEIPEDATDVSWGFRTIDASGGEASRVTFAVN